MARPQLIWLVCAAISQTAAAGMLQYSRTTTLSLASGGSATNGGWLATSDSVSVPYFDTLGGSRVLNHVFLDFHHLASLMVDLQNPTADNLGVRTIVSSCVWIDTPFFANGLSYATSPYNWDDVQAFSTRSFNHESENTVGIGFNSALSQFNGSGDYSVTFQGEWTNFEAAVLYANAQPVNEYPFPGDQLAITGQIDVGVTAYYYFDEVAVPLPNATSLGGLGLVGLLVRRKPRGLAPARGGRPIDL